MSGRLGKLVCIGVLILLSACGSTDKSREACLDGLSERGIVFRPLKDWEEKSGCGVTNAVEVRQSAIKWDKKAAMTCPLALKIWDYETKVVQPAAQSIFGQKVAVIHHYGSYSCRNQIGSGKRRLSEHAKGNAFDIGVFELADGTRISVSRDWSDRGKKGQFLKRVSKGACDVFMVVLTPAYNQAHWDHIHVDMGPWKLCGV